MDLIESTDSLLARAADDVAGTLAGAKVHMYETDLTLEPTLPSLADFVAAVATYTGYAAATITWGTPSIADDGTVEVVGTVPAFRPSADVAGKSVWGIWITDTTSATLLFAGQYDEAPLPMAATTDEILLVVRYRPADTSLVVVIS